jgi:hypothetical protein
MLTIPERVRLLDYSLPVLTNDGLKNLVFCQVSDGTVFTRLSGTDAWVCPSAIRVEVCTLYFGWQRIGELDLYAVGELLDLIDPPF